ncbi:L,D-transpeptidase family protein [Allostreptomyces psammosilenae]|uniref:L,D-transpeptidase family protein n=1 Tax=Allostreptomyces psammosilenae TaxID=1892865 RepID=UPI0015CEAC51
MGDQAADDDPAATPDESPADDAEAPRPEPEPADPSPSGPASADPAPSAEPTPSAGAPDDAEPSGNPETDPAAGSDPEPDAPAAPGPDCAAETGSHQREVEEYLGLPVDGEQSVEDCRAIRDFQREHGIEPDEGYAGPITWSSMQQLELAENPNADGACPTDLGRIACVDLTRQVMWVQDGEEVVFAPVPVRTGRDGYETRTGLKQVYWKSEDHWSTLYDVEMPYAQFFDGGQAFHAITGDIYSPPGSHGCVNMRHEDARALWDLLDNGDDVYVWGTKPGT